MKKQTVLIPLLIMWLGLATHAAESSAQEPLTAAPAAENHSDNNLKLSRFPVVLGLNLSSNLFTRKNLLPFVIGAAGALAVAPADRKISRSLRNDMHEFGTAGSYFGSIVPLSVTGGAFLVGFRSKDDNMRSFGITLAQAYATSTVLTQGMKLATRRTRPDRSSPYSFPSAHTSTSFAFATVISSHYGKKWGILSYSIAGLIGLSRVEKGKHWPSDVVAGAALGYISAESALLGTKRERSRHRPSTLIITPSNGHDQRSLSVILHY